MIQNLREHGLRRELVSIAKRMNEIGLNQGTSGNLSVRIKDGLLITPSSLPYEEMKPKDLVAIDFLGNPFSPDQLKPSSEWQFHADILANRPDVGAVLHCHSIYATSLSCHKKSIPSFHYMVAVAGGHDVRCAPYATFGTKELSKLALKALEGRLACLLAHHGQIALGINLRESFQIAIEIETLAKMYLQASQIGEPFLLSSQQMNEVQKKFENLNYGKNMN